MRILPEERLLWAMLERGILDYIGKLKPVDIHAGCKWYANARSWVNSDGDDVFGFVWTCQALELDPITVRRRIHKLARSCPKFEPAAFGAVSLILDNDTSSPFALEKISDRSISDSVELERKRA